MNKFEIEKIKLPLPLGFWRITLKQFLNSLLVSQHILKHILSLIILSLAWPWN